MPTTHAPTPGSSLPLRHTAETRLKNGNPPAALGGWTTGLDALSLLHNLAGSPASAGDAIKLLHELQVHQVELTLQQEQLEQTRAETAEMLDRYIERFEFAPLGYFAVEPDGRVIETNLAGAELFKIDRANTRGIPVENLVAAESRGALRALLQRLRDGERDGNCLARLGPDSGERRVLQVIARAASRQQCVYMSFTDISHCAAAIGSS